MNTISLAFTLKIYFLHTLIVIKVVNDFHQVFSESTMKIHIYPETSFFLSISTFQRLFVIWNIASSRVFWGIYFAWNRVLRSEVIIRKRDFPLCQETCPSNYLGRWNHCFCHELHSCNICYGKFFILERQVEKNCLIRFRFWRKEQIALRFTWNESLADLKGAFSWWKNTDWCIVCLK